MFAHTHVFEFCGLVYAGGYAVQQVGKPCTSETLLTSIDECRVAEISIDPTAGSVMAITSASYLKGCFTRRKGQQWYFNNHATGVAEAISAPVCKTGESHTELGTINGSHSFNALACINPDVNSSSAFICCAMVSH